MKIYCKITCSLILLTTLVLAQVQNIHKEVYASAYYDKENSSRIDLLSGIVLEGTVISLKDNTYWIKKGTITSVAGDVLVSFNKLLIVNNKKAIDQVEADYGYILEIVRENKGNTLFYVWIANRSGQRDSDDIIIDIKH